MYRQLECSELAQFKVKFRFLLFCLVVAKHRYRCKCNFKDTVALQMSYFRKINIFISLDDCQFVEYLSRIQNNRIQTSYIIYHTKFCHIFFSV